jgi:type II restriction enzyme
MTSAITPKIDTFRAINPMIYSWRTPDLPKYAGWEKIGYTDRQTVDARIAQQASQLGIKKDIVWALSARYLTEAGGYFRDGDFHAYLKQQGVERETPPKFEQRTEWHNFGTSARGSKDYFFDFASQDYTDFQVDGEEDYTLRPEQRAAVAQAVAAFAQGSDEILWNAKPRFGKTLTTYHLMRELQARRVLIVTNRPAIANSWFDDFQRFIAHQTTYKFVSESSSLSERSTMSREQWRTFSGRADVDQDPRIVEFVSLQDLKGSVYFGGSFKKLKHIAEFDWDLLVIDEAHEGIDTTKTDVAFDQIKRARTLHLSGTPFKALASGKFDRDQIFNWTYENERSAQENWPPTGEENPYDALPTLNLLTYQLSRMISDRLAEGVAIDEDSANIDFTFDLNEFFTTKDNGFFEYAKEVEKFLDCLTTNEKYPFSTPELRDEVRHSFWLLNRVASAKALEKLLKKHPVFKDYTIVLAAGDGRSDESDPDLVGKSLDKVRSAIADAEKAGGKTITLSVGQLTTGVTVPEWTAVIMLSSIASPSLYTQAAFRAQNPHTFQRGDAILQKKNAYIFDFAPERTLTIFDEFANNLGPSPVGNPEVRRENIRRLLNFFPVIGEDSQGRMVELDATQVLTFPQVFKAREVVRRGFLSNLLFENVSGIFRFTEQVRGILDKLPVAKEQKVVKGDPIEIPHPPPVTNHAGEVEVDRETVINPKVAELGPPVWSTEDIPKVTPDTPALRAGALVARAVTEQSRLKREELKEAYDLTSAQLERDVKATEQRIQAEVERAYKTHEIAKRHLDDERESAATEEEAAAVAAKQAEEVSVLEATIQSIVAESMEAMVPAVVEREETKKEQRRADKTMDDTRDRLRGFARTIPMFLMAYGKPEITLETFDDYTPDDVFEEITGITEAEFRVLRDGQAVTDEDGKTHQIPGLFDEAVFNESIQEFLRKKAELADYFDDALTEDIFAYIPRQQTSLVFTPRHVVRRMVDIVENENPDVFGDPSKTFADPVSTNGLFLMDIVRRLDVGLAQQIPDQGERLQHILTKQIFKISQSQIMNAISLEAVSGGDAERRRWLEDSGHFQVSNISRMTPDERQQLVEDMLTEGA